MENMDKCNAFVPSEMITVAPNRTGKLSSLTFAVKELYDVKGFITGCGNMHWKSTHSVAEDTAPVVETLLNEGATMVGKTISDEMAFSLDGENVHYGTPLNSMCPDRIPGGSSSGSASAVAGGLVDFALGTDTAGSIRIPASYCGIYGFRPSHGIISLDGVHPMASSFDVVGWLSRTPDILAKIGSVLLSIDIPEFQIKRIVIAQDLFDALEPTVTVLYDSFIESLSNLSIDVVRSELGKPDFSTWIEVLRNIQWWELNNVHGKWISKNLDTFGEEIRGRLEKIPSVTQKYMEDKKLIRKDLVSYIDTVIPKGTIAVLPTAPDIAPLKGRPIDEARAFRANAMKNICISTIAGLPQVSMPLIEKVGCPIGVSLLGARGEDAQLLAAAKFFGGV
jgi:amidase